MTLRAARWCRAASRGARRPVRHPRGRARFTQRPARLGRHPASLDRRPPRCACLPSREPRPGSPSLRGVVHMHGRIVRYLRRDATL